MAINKLRFFADTKKCLVIDQTDYENLNIPLAFVNAKLLGTIGGPSSAVVVKDSPSDPLVNLVIETQSAEFSLPLANGEILNGDYTLDTSLNMSRSNLVSRTLSSGGINTISIIGFDLSGCFVSGDTVTLSGSTLGNNGVKNITAVSWNGNDTILTVSETLVNESANLVSSFDITRTSWFVGSYNYSGCNLISLTTSTTYDCTGTQFGSIYFYDTTILPAGQTLVSRLWSIEYPSNLVPAPIVNPVTSEDQNVFIYQLATGPWGYRLDYTIQVDQADELQVYYSPTTGSQNVTVSCVGDICSILDCYKKLVAQADQDIAANGASSLSGTLLLVNSYLEIASNQKACGDEAGFCATIDVVKGLIEASGSCTCGCSDSTGNAWVNNAGFDAQTQIEAMAEEIAQIQTNMVTVQEQSAIALENSNQAIIAAESAALQAGNAQVSANQAQLAADTAQSAANTAQSAADTAQSAADAAQSTATAALNASETNTDDITALTTVVASKVASVTGALVDNTDPQNPVINQTYFDEDQFIGNGVDSPIFLDSLDASHVNINPAISGLSATNAQSAFSELQTSKLETVAVDGTTITGDGTVGNPLVAHSYNGPLVYAARLTQQSGGDPSVTVITNTTGATITWIKIGGGTFKFTASSAVFTMDKTILLTQASGSGNYIIIGGMSSTTQGIILTGSSFGSSWSDNLLNGAVVKIEIYP